MRLSRPCSDFKLASTGGHKFGYDLPSLCLLEGYVDEVQAAGLCAASKILSSFVPLRDGTPV